MLWPLMLALDQSGICHAVRVRGMLTGTAQQ
jgi:hypothetical protein